MNSDAARSRMETLKRKVSFIALCAVLWSVSNYCVVMLFVEYISGLGCALVSTGSNSVGRRPASSFHLCECVPVLTTDNTHP